MGEVIFLGDYIDRGPKNKEVVDLLMAGPPEGWKWTTIRGNHEDLAIEAFYEGPSENRLWLMNGGASTLVNYESPRMPSEVIRFFISLPRYKYDDHRIFTHAYASDKYPLDKQPENVTQWSRPRENEDFPCHGRYLVHGHTPVNGDPFIGEHRANLDIGGVWSNKLAVAVFDTNVAGPPEHVEVIHFSKLDFV